LDELDIRMKILWVFAHPEPRSLNGSLREFAVQTLTRAGHTVKVSDLYAMRWKAIADGDDFVRRDRSERLEYMEASRQAFSDGTQSADISAEQEKVRWADTLILQFPLWWFSMPAIMKGWVERVFANGFAYGLMDPSWPGRSLRYGGGPLHGRRAMLVVTAANRESAMGARGVSGNIDNLLFPIHHGILWYVGMDVLPPFVIHNVSAGRVSPQRYDEIRGSLETRLLAMELTAPIPYRSQNSGDYDEDFVLKPGLEGVASGLGIHVRGER
jgi:NAD(P)H dehydrogenase (quinone)